MIKVNYDVLTKSLPGQRDNLDVLQLKSQLRELEGRYRCLIENASAGIINIDRGGKIATVNDALCGFTGYDRDELVGRSFIDFIHRDDREKIMGLFLDAMDNNMDVEAVEFRAIHKNREIIHLHTRPNVLIMDDKIIGISGIIIDISDKIMTQQKLKEQYEFIDNVLESLPYPFYVINADTYEIEIANGATRIFNDIGTRKTCFEITHGRQVPCSSSDHPCPVDRIKRDKRPMVVEHQHINKEGKKKVYEVHAHPIFNDNGRVIRIIEYLLDITDRKRSEDKLRRSLEERDVLFKELRHRVKNNLQLLSSMVDMQIMRSPGQNTADKLREVQSVIETMALIYTKAFEGTKIMELNLNMFINELVNGLIKLNTVRDLEIDYSISGDSIVLNTDRAIPLVLIVNELIFNSLKHAFHDKKQGNINIHLKKHEEVIEINVRDDGPGIPPEVNMEKPRSLGLKLVRNLIEQLNGVLEINIDEGTEFQIRVPIEEL